MPVARPRLTAGLVLLAVCATVSGGCSPEDSSVTAHRAALTHPGPWVIPAETLAVGDTQQVAYTGAGPWPGNCAGSITEGAHQLQVYLAQAFPQIASIGGYDCRAINGDSSKMSVHGTGRALDLMIPTIGGDADNDAGDSIGHWLIENAEAIGIQYIIWDLWTWRADRPAGAKDRAYGGAHDHKNHLHIELSVDGGNARTPFFADSGSVTPAPGPAECEPIGSDGGVIDEQSPCFQMHGESKYWRSVAGQGYGGSLLWTDAYDASAPNNWARWNIVIDSAAEYIVEYYAEPTYAVHSGARYLIRHQGIDLELNVDQAKATRGWNELARLRFDAGGGQHVSIYDNYPGLTAEDQHIVVDAIRLRRVTADQASVEQPAPDPNLERAAPGTEGQPVLGGRGPSNAYGTCNLSATPAGPGAELVGLLLLVLASRRRRSFRRGGVHAPR